MPNFTLVRLRSNVCAGFFVCVLCGIAASCGSGPDGGKAAAPEQLTVAAAANLTQFANQLGPAFESATHIHPVFSFAATAQLTQQIENGAPLDVFLSADAAHVQELDDKKLLTPGTRAPYAIGVLALWIPDATLAISGVESLTQPQVKVIAVAKPELAPYGQAAVETLQRSGVWDKVKSKIVYGENINVVRQYGSSHNADAVFTAYSLVRTDGGQVIQIGEKLHEPIVQELGIVASTGHLAAARRFTEFLRTGPGRELLTGAGYRLP